MTPSSRSSLATASGVPPFWRCGRDLRDLARGSGPVAPGDMPRPAAGHRTAARRPPTWRVRHRPRPCGSWPSRSTPLIRVCAVNGMKLALSGVISRPRSPYFSLASTTMRAAFGRFVGERRELRGVGQFALADARQRERTPSPARLPSVIVPVLSSSSVSTSPAASTARPDIAMTLRCIRRSMPAMPIADKQAADRRRDQADQQRDQHVT